MHPTAFGPEFPSVIALSGAAKPHKEQPVMRQSHRKSRSLLLIGLPALLLACGGSDGTASTPIAGTYAATFFQTTGSSGQTNQLAGGSTLQITLATNGTTTGHLHFTGTGGAPFDADMAGTWTASGNIVDFTQAADSFVRDMPFTWGSDIQGISTLAGDKVFAGTRIQLTLTRSSL
jgi:hypothetical protein